MSSILIDISRSALSSRENIWQWQGWEVCLFRRYCNWKHENLPWSVINRKVSTSIVQLAYTKRNVSFWKKLTCQRVWENEKSQKYGRTYQGASARNSHRKKLKKKTYQNLKQALSLHFQWSMTVKLMTSTNHYVNIQLEKSFHLALIYPIFFFQITPMELDCNAIILLYVHDKHYCFSFSLQKVLQHCTVMEIACCCCCWNTAMFSWLANEASWKYFAGDSFSSSIVLFVPKNLRIKIVLLPLWETKIAQIINVLDII